MSREDVKELIEQYFEDGFEFIDISTNDNKTIFIDTATRIVFNFRVLHVESDEFNLYIPYENIEYITI